jgi:hypothetical protein
VEINGDKRQLGLDASLLSLCGMELLDSEEKMGDYEYVMRLFICQDEEAADGLVLDGIKEEGVRELLLKMGILVRKTEEQVTVI